ncbi:MAG: DUF2283 domain-containing protein [Chloroflexi bacterium]|nr:DUF2283 domain-containing protein [Chloroflexota bacterium]
MKVRYDRKFDIADIILSDDLAGLTSELVRDNFVLDFAEEILVRIEVQQASQHLDSRLLEGAETYQSTVGTRK